MFGVVAEDKSDGETLKILIKRLLDKPNASVRVKGYTGCGELCNKAASQFRNFQQLGVRWFVACMDADGPSPATAKARLRSEVIDQVPLNERYICIVPVEEIEAWIIADEKAVNKVIPTFRLKPVLHPETIASPKEWIENESRIYARPRYMHPVHNPRVAEHLDLNLVAGKCPSFLELKRFVDVAAAELQ